MAKKVEGYIKLQIPAGKATPAPPVGPALGQHGVNIVEFTKQFNAKTADKGDVLIPVVGFLWMTCFTRGVRPWLPCVPSWTLAVLLQSAFACSWTAVTVNSRLRRIAQALRSKPLGTRKSAWRLNLLIKKIPFIS